ncbi:hypothetical protein NQ315_010612 [Exocentrus adspersus]|uniref:Paraneoplastic antigen Ma-like C-terminal domain-containing protein n=1 Tax=Exocentrus adspersus TaxID=1586481 RepID=A0AAV8W5W0_9CUCU|nr:hypothetical protein NQ315_010612 [Exocentrus adspersus]
MEDSMKQLMEMLSAMKASQEEMKEDMRRGKEELKEDLKIGQEELKEDMRRVQEEMKANQEEMKQKLEDKLQEMKTTIEKEINQEKEGVKEDKKEINKKIEDLSTTGIIKTEGSVAATKIKVPTYDGKVSWNTYLRQFEAVVRNWREEEKATSLIAALRGEALEVLRTIPEGSQDYKAVTSALEKRYGDAHLQHVYQAQLRHRKQRFEETLQQYEADLLLRLSNSSVSSFVDGLRDPEISQLVRLARHKTIHEALVQALEIEAAKEASRFAINPYQGRD